MPTGDQIANAKRRLEELLALAKRQYSELEGAMEAYKAKRKRFDDEAPSYLQAVKNLVADMEAYEEKRKEHNNLVERAIQVQDDYNAKVEVAENARVTLNEAIDYANECITEYNENRHTSDAERLRRRVEEARRRVDERRADYDNAVRRMEGARPHLREMVDKVRASKEALDNESERIDARTEEVNKWKSRRDATENELQNEATRIQSLHSNLKSTNEEIKTVRDLITRLENSGYTIAIYRCPLAANGIEILKHYAIHFEENNSTVIYEYGRYPTGRLRIREKGKYDDEELVTAWKMLEGATPKATVIQELVDYCRGKKWTVMPSNEGTNCFHAAGSVALDHGVPAAKVLFGVEAGALFMRGLAHKTMEQIDKAYASLQDMSARL